MAESQKIKSSEIVEPNLFDNTTKSAQKLSDKLTVLEIGFEDIIKTQKKVFATNPYSDAKNIKIVIEAIDKTTKATEGLNAVKKAKIELTAKEQAQAELDRKQRKELVDLEKAELILNDKNRGAIEKLNAANTKLRIARDKVNTSTKQGQDELKKLNKMIDLNNAQIIKQSDQLKKSKLNVGNYTASIRAALSETGVFDNGISRLVINLRNMLVSLKANSEGSNKFGLALKGVGIGLIIAAIAGLTSVLKANLEVTNFLSQTWADFKDVLSFGTTSFGDAERAAQSLRVELRKMNLELQLLVLDEEDFKEISNDTTLGYIERDAALQKSFELREKIAAKNVEIAQKELDTLNAELIAGAALGIASDELLDKRNQAQLKLNKALDDQNDLERITGAEQRKRFEDELLRDLQLIRSKKKSSTAAIDLLDKQISDETIMFQEREAALVEFDRLNKRTYETQIKLIEKATGVEIDQADLLAERNNILLAEKIKNLNLSEAITNELAAIIKKSQDAEIKGLEKADALEKERIQNQTKIQKLQSDRQQAIKLDELNDLELQRGLQSQTNSTLTGKDLTAGIATVNSLDQEIFEKKVANLGNIKTIEERNAIDTIHDEEVLKEALLNIENQYYIDLQNLTEENNQRQLQAAKDEKDRLLQIEREKTAAVVFELQKITSATSDELDKRSQKQQDAFDREADLREKSIDRQQELAAQGLDNQLAFEQSQAAKSELSRKDALEKAQKEKEALQLTEAYFGFLNSELNSGTPAGQAAGKALFDTLGAKAASKGLVQFLAEGSPDILGPGTETSDSIPVMASKHEAMIPAWSNKKHKGVAKALIDDTFNDMYISRSQLNDAANGVEKSSMEKAFKSLFIQENKEVVQLLREINAKPVQQVDVDKFGNLIETIYSAGSKKVIKHINTRPRI